MSMKFKNWVDSPTVVPDSISTTAKAVQDTIKQIRDAKALKENISNSHGNHTVINREILSVKKYGIEESKKFARVLSIEEAEQFKADYSYNKNGAYVDPDEPKGYEIESIKKISDDIYQAKTRLVTTESIDEILTTGLQDIKHLLKPPAERTTRLPTELIHQVHTHTPNRAEREYWAEKGKTIPEYSPAEAVQLHKAHALNMIEQIRDEAGYGRGGGSGESTKTKLKLKRK